MPMTIKEAAQQALEILGKPSTTDQIFETILTNKLFEFNTDVPQHVLRTTLKRHSENSTRTDSFDEILFIELDEDRFSKASKPESRRMRNPGSKRIHRAKDKEAIIADLTSPELGVFKEIWRLLIFAASLGFSSGQREPLGSIDQGKGIDQATFGNSPTWPGLLYLFAINETQSEEVMRATEEAEDVRIRVFEEYANAGLSILRDHFTKKDFDITNLIELAGQLMQPDELPKPDLSI
jgi:dnd system-associated protein 4